MVIKNRDNGTERHRILSIEQLLSIDAVDEELKYLILALTTCCNLQCAYCYHGEARQLMDMAQDVIEHALDLAQRGTGSFHLQLTGGEPTLVPDLIKYTVLRAHSLSRPCTIGIQTNGTALTKDLVDFFREQQIQVGISLDGPPAIHQQLRGQMSQTLEGIRLLESRDVPFRVTTVVSGHNISSLNRLVLLLAGFRQARGIGLDLLVNKGRALNGVQPVSADSLASGLRAMVATLQAINLHRSIPLQLREMEKVRRLADTGNKPRSFCHACLGQSMAVHPDGRLFPCGQTFGDNHFLAGTVLQPETLKLQILPDTQSDSKQCEQCPLKNNCPGDCPSRIYYNKKSSSSGLACVMYRTLWESLV
jgi:uncharacterized protein